MHWLDLQPVSINSTKIERTSCHLQTTRSVTLSSDLSWNPCTWRWSWSNYLYGKCAPRLYLLTVFWNELLSSLVTFWRRTPQWLGQCLCVLVSDCVTYRPILHWPKAYMQVSGINWNPSRRRRDDILPDQPMPKTSFDIIWHEHTVADGREEICRKHFTHIQNPPIIKLAELDLFRLREWPALRSKPHLPMQAYHQTLLYIFITCIQSQRQFHSVCASTLSMNNSDM